MAFNTILSSIFLQLCLASLGLAAPVSTESLDNSWQYGTGGGLIGLVVLILDIIVFGTFVPSTNLVHLRVNHSSWILILFLNSRGPEIEPYPRPKAHLVLGRLPVPCYRHDRLLSLLKPFQLPARLGLRGIGVMAGGNHNFSTLTRHEK